MSDQQADTPILDVLAKMTTAAISAVLREAAMGDI